MEQWDKSLIQIEIIQDILHSEFEDTNPIQPEPNYIQISIQVVHGTHL